MKKKFLALVLTLAMVLSLVPVTALAADETSDTTTKDVVYGHYEGENGTIWTQGQPTRTDSLKNTVTIVNKTAEKVDGQNNQYEVTLTVQMKHKTEEVQPGAAATVLVIDTSGSMNDDNRLSAAKTAAINFLKSYSGFSDSNFNKNGSLKNNVRDKKLKRYVSLVTFNGSASVEESWIDVSTRAGYNKLLNAIDDIEAGGGTNLDAALRLANTQMQSDSITQIDKSKRNVIALTDGVPTCYVKETWLVTKNVSQHGSYGCPDTNAATTRSADALKEKVNAVYTVCFGAANDRCWTKDSAHAWFGLIETEWHTIDGPRVGDFLKDNIATKEQYAYNADDANGLYGAFAAITQTITDGLNEGVVTDGLPAGVTDVEGSGFATTWTLDSSSVTPTTSNGYNVYTYTKTYRVNVDPATAKTVADNGVNYAPLNTPTILTVQHNGSPVQIPFPIPAGKVTYSLTNFNKELVTKSDTLSFDTNVFTIPDTKDSTVTVGEDGVTLLYKITVAGNAGAKFTVIDTGATLVSPTDGSITENTANSTFSGTVDSTGTTVFYVSKHFDVTTGMTSVSNTATIVPGDNANGPDDKEKTVDTTVTEAKPQTYTVIFDANGGKWTDTEDQKQQTYRNRSDSVTPVADPARQGYDFDGWAYKTSEDKLELITTFAGATVDRMMKLPKATGTSVTLYAVWKDNNTAPTGSLNYRINQYFIDETGKVANSISKPGRNTVNTAISTLISDLIHQDRSFPNYQYEKAKTTVNGEQYTDNKKLTQDNTVINLYYYLDSWKDGDTDPGNTTGDSLIDGDDIPDCKQILIQYQVYQEGNGQVSPTFEVVTVNDNGTKTEIKGSTATATPKYVFVTWTKGKVTDKNVGELATTISTEKHCTPVSGELEVGQPYTYTAIFLEDKVGKKDKDGNDKGDDIPDAWQYKVTFKVANGKWNDQTSADVVAYVTNKDKDGTPCAKDTKGSKATLDGVTIPVAGSQPDSGYRASGNWDTTPSATTEITKEDTVFIYTYDQKSGGSGGSGGSHKPTVTIPDDVPTGLNGKDHYAYVVGYPDGMVYPQKNITRAEVATIFFRLLKDETREANMTKSNGYNDMKDGAWYTCAVSTLSKMGIIKGYEDGSFKPDASISRAEFAAIAARFDPDGDTTPATFSDVSSHWAKDEISIAANHGWIKGYEDGSFKPDQKITRAETMTLVNRVLKRLPETKDDLHKDMKTWPDNQNESAWFYLAVQEATNSHYQKLKKDGTHETWESMRETRDWAALEK